MQLLVASFSENTWKLRTVQFPPEYLIIFPKTEFYILTYHAQKTTTILELVWTPVLQLPVLTEYISTTSIASNQGKFALKSAFFVAQQPRDFSRCIAARCLLTILYGAPFVHC